MFFFQRLRTRIQSKTKEVFLSAVVIFILPLNPLARGRGSEWVTNARKQCCTFLNQPLCLAYSLLITNSCCISTPFFSSESLRSLGSGDFLGLLERLIPGLCLLMGQYCVSPLLFQPRSAHNGWPGRHCSRQPLSSPPSPSPLLLLSSPPFFLSFLLHLSIYLYHLYFAFLSLHPLLCSLSPTSLFFQTRSHFFFPSLLPLSPSSSIWSY